jgi:hypothetical protein
MHLEIVRRNRMQLVELIFNFVLFYSTCLVYVNHKTSFLFHFQVYGQGVNNEQTSTTVRHSTRNTENLPINLELSVQRDKSETPSVG